MQARPTATRQSSRRGDERNELFLSVNLDRTVSQNMAQQEDASLQKLLKHIPYSTVDFLSILMQGVIPFKFDLIDITDCLLGKNVGGVKSLLKVALLSLIEKAMNKQEKRIVLRELVVNCCEF